MRRIVQLALFGLCAVGGFVLVGTASTATTTTTVIAYNDLGGSAYVTDQTGTSPTTAYDSTQTSGVVTCDVSPDGKTVLVDDGNALDTVPATGGSPAAISGTDGATSGSYSPDGTTIVFATADGIYTIPAAGGTATQIVATPDGDTDSIPSYSPNGKTVAFARDAFDSDFNETITIELTPAAGGGSLTDLQATPYTDASSGGRLSFSPDGKTIAFAATAGISTIPVAGGSVTQLTSDNDSSPVYSPDGKTIYFSRSAFSQNADDQQSSPKDPNANDIAELWSMSSTGAGAAVIKEGDYENLSLTGVKSSSSKTTTTTKGGTTTTGTSTGTGTGTTGTTTTTKTGTTKTKAATGTVTSIAIAISGKHYRVTWKGRTSNKWKVTLKVGKKTAAAKVAGAVHAHTFTVAGKGTVTAAVVPSN